MAKHTNKITFMENPANLLEVRNLTGCVKIPKGFLWFLNDISFDIQKGEIMGVVGESGSGKTRLAYGILGLINDVPGVIRGDVRYFDQKNNLVIDINDEYLKQIGLELDDSDVKSSVKNISEIRIHDYIKQNRVRREAYRKVRGRGISMIFQDAKGSMNPIKTVGYQLMLCLINNSSQDCTPAWINGYPLFQYLYLKFFKKELFGKYKQQIMNYLNAVKLRDPDKVFGSLPSDLSGGMAQRVLILLAIASNSSITIVDEPTTGLDAVLRREIIDLFRLLQEDTVNIDPQKQETGDPLPYYDSVLIRDEAGKPRKKDRAVMLISHDIHLIPRVTDRMMVLYAGEIIEYGPVEHFRNWLEFIQADSQIDLDYMNKLKKLRPIHPYTLGLLLSSPDVDKLVLMKEIMRIKECLVGAGLNAESSEELAEKIDFLARVIENPTPNNAKNGETNGAGIVDVIEKIMSFKGRNSIDQQKRRSPAEDEYHNKFVEAIKCESEELLAMVRLRKMISDSLSINTVHGEVPDLSELPSGCAFHARCQSYANICGILNKVNHGLLLDIPLSPEKIEMFKKMKSLCDGLEKDIHPPLIELTVDDEIHLNDVSGQAKNRQHQLRCWKYCRSKDRNFYDLYFESFESFLKSSFDKEIKLDA